MNLENINIASLLKFITINFCVSYSFFRTINYNKLKLITKIALIIVGITLAILQCLIQPYIPLVLRILLIYFIYSFILSNVSKIPIGNSILVVTFCLSISYIVTYISVFVILLLMKALGKHPCDEFIMFLNLFVSSALTYLFFTIKRFKHGIPFIKNISNKSYLDIFTLVVSTIIVFTYFFYNFVKGISAIYVTIGFALLSLVMFLIIQKAFTFYHKQKLQLQTLKHYEQELQQTQEKLQTAITEKQKLIKSNHEFYHRQESLNKKLDDLIKQQKISANIEMSTEFGNDYSDILDRIHKLSTEYENKTHIIPTLEKTGIIEIDDMLSYLQSECIKNNIEFILKINCDVNYIIENFISISQLETLLGDLIRNSIISINHSSESFKSIMIIFGIKNKTYELCVFDSGIPFEINTLLKLGIEPASTHLNEGGSGIGFITTFETMESCNSSFIINEITGNTYTKSLEIKFDNKHEYVVISDRKEEIVKNNLIVNRENIVLK